jgi:hypothetical protein
MYRKSIYLVSLVLALVLVGVAGAAEGLFGQYFVSSGEGPPVTPWQTLVLERLDPMVNFNWAGNSPDPSLNAEDFAVRWTGEVEAPTSETYTFQILSDDGILLWVNNELIIDNWAQGNTTDNGTIALTAGQRYKIRIEYYENDGGARCELFWSTPTISLETVPSRYLSVEMPDPHYPDPVDGAIIKDTWIPLSWTPGDYAASHSIYVGENRDEVKDGTGDTFKVNQTDTSYAVGFIGYPYPDGVVKGTTYYWRIEDVEADGTTIRSGPVWSFMIAPRTAYSPSPADGEDFVDPNVALSWEPGFGAILHTVFFGDDYDSVNDAVAGIPQGAPIYNPGTLESGKTYYWRVDEFFGFETLKGEVWSFTAPGAVGSAKPYHGAVNVKQTSILRWIANDNADSHQVYFGTDKDAVSNATTASPEYKGSQNLDDVSYDPGLLEQDTTYCWRIDEVNNLNPNSPWKGNVWTFTTADFLVVDGFESYNDIDPPNPGSNTIFGYWFDGYQTTTNGALIGNDFPPYTEQALVHGGRQSLPYDYDITIKFAEATLTLESPRNWTQNEASTLTIWFHGNMFNDAAPIYVAIANTTGAAAVVTHSDPSATQIHRWTQWDIPLQAFADKGIDLTNVNSIIIGIGDKANPPGGLGKMNFDDIGLH